MAQNKLTEIAKIFLRLGIIGFGGPAAHIALMEEEIVRKREWMSHTHFLDLVGITNLIPGPNSTEMVMHCGYHRAGWKGLIVAGTCFILPAVIIMSFLAHLYVQYGQLPSVEPFIHGIKPAVISLILSLVVRLTKKAMKSWELAVAGIAALVLAWTGFHEIYIFLGVGLAGTLLSGLFKGDRTMVLAAPLVLSKYAGNWDLFLTFLKVGAILYGSGYVLFAFLQTELVDTGILTIDELTNAIAAGQFTPGPVLTSATFIGWQLNGPMGALAATIGIFLPSFIFVGLINPFVHKIRKSKILSTFLDYINMIAVALILNVCFDIGKGFMYEWRALLIAAIGLLVNLKFKKLNGAFIILGGAVLGYLLMLV